MQADDLKGRILAAARSEPSSTRRQHRIRSALRIGSALVVPLVLFLEAGGPRVGPRPFGLVATTALGTSGIAAIALLVAVGRGSSMLGRSRRELLATAAIAPVAFLLWKVSATWGVPHMMDPWPTRPGLRCFALTTLFAAWPVAALVWERWGTDPVHPRALGVALGVAAGTLAAALVDLWCPVGHVPHVLAGHVAPILLLGALGALAGERALAVRARQH